MSRKTAKADLTPVRQRTQYTCMSTSMMMCLRALGHECDEDEVNKVMGARPMKGAAWEQALACAQHYGCRATLTSPSTVKQLKEWTDAGKPVMIAWNPEGREWSHASVVFDVDDDLNVYVADPNIPDPDETVRVVPKGEFYKKWYEKWPNYLVRRPAMMIDREITADGRQVMASSDKPPNPPVQFLDGGGDLMVMVAAEPVEEDVKDRDLPEPPDEEMLADGIPHLVDAYYKDMELWEKWQRQGWWPRPVKVWKWKVVVLHRPTKKYFESDPFDTKREAIRMAEVAIPKVMARRRPRWLKPAKANDYKGHRRRASAKRVASAFARKAAQARIDNDLKRDINARMRRLGLDGNGRFRKPDRGFAAAVDAMQENGVTLDGVVSAREFSARPSGTVRADIAFIDESQPLAPGITISNSILYLQYTEVSDDRFEVVAYLS